MTPRKRATGLATITRMVGVAGVASLMALTLTSCGEGSPSQSETTATSAEEAPGGTEGADTQGATDTDGADAPAEDLTPVAVGTIPIASSVELRYGVEQGIFEKHGLDVELVEGQGGAALLPAVQTDALQFGVGNPMSVLTAVDQGLGMKVVSGYSWSAESGDDINAVIALADSGIESFADLEGKTVTVNAVHTLGDLSIMESVNMEGGDPSAVRFNEMPFPDMIPQLEAGNVDAIWITEPFLGNALDDPKFSVVGQPNQKVMPGMPLTIAFTSDDFAEQNPDVVEKFRDALTEATEEAWQNEEDLRAMLPGFLRMDDQTAQSIRLEPAHTELPPGENAGYLRFDAGIRYGH